MRVSTPAIALALKITAFVNIGAALGALIAPDLNASMMLGPDAALTGLLLRHHVLFWSTVLAMGLGYAVAAADPERQTGLLLAAGLGKMCVAGIWLEMVITGLGTPMMLGGIIFDGLFGLMFLVYVLQRRGRATSAD